MQLDTSTAAAIIVCLVAIAIPLLLYLRHNLAPDPSLDPSAPNFDVTGQSRVCIALAEALPDCVFSSRHPNYNKTVGSYWSQTACELRPSCVIRPRSAHDVAAAITILKAEFDATKNSANPLRFAVRSGGHSPEAGFASVAGAPVIDMSLISTVDVSESRQTVTIGTGARWHDVSSKLDGMGLATVGGRNSDVGVGGLVLGGGVSFFSPRYGMVCDNVDAYEVVLANGSIVQVTSSHHQDLWRALKGGTGNFGIVTRVTIKTFEAGQIWAGYAYWAGWQRSKVLKAFADFNKPENFDEFAAGPILVLAYVQKLGVHVTASSLVYTKPEKWPSVFKGFNSIWRLWSTTKIQSLTKATQELAGMAPAGKRQFQATTTVRNDLDTIHAFNEIYRARLKDVKDVQGAVWALVFQPVSAAIMHKGSPNVLGLDSRSSTDALLVVLVCVAWPNAQDDELVHRVSREIVCAGEEMALKKGTADPYRYLNYAASGQDPIGSYGEANKKFLQETSKLYDSDGFFQRAKQGGFKLDLY